MTPSQSTNLLADLPPPALFHFRAFVVEPHLPRLRAGGMSLAIDPAALPPYVARVRRHRLNQPRRRDSDALSRKTGSAREIWKKQLHAGQASRFFRYATPAEPTHTQQPRPRGIPLPTLRTTHRAAVAGR